MDAYILNLNKGYKLYVFKDNTLSFYMGGKWIESSCSSPENKLFKQFNVEHFKVDSLDEAVNVLKLLWE